MKIAKSRNFKTGVILMFFSWVQVLQIDKAKWQVSEVPLHAEHTSLNPLRTSNFLLGDNRLSGFGVGDEEAACSAEGPFKPAGYALTAVNACQHCDD
jgi:hypothetical protein